MDAVGNSRFPWRGLHWTVLSLELLMATVTCHSLCRDRGWVRKKYHSHLHKLLTAQSWFQTRQGVGSGGWQRALSGLGTKRTLHCSGSLWSRGPASEFSVPPHLLPEGPPTQPSAESQPMVSPPLRPDSKCPSLVPRRVSLCFLLAGSGASSPLTSPSSPTPPSTAGE